MAPNDPTRQEEMAPNDPTREEEERAAAKRFLGWDWEEFEGGQDKIGKNGMRLMKNLYDQKERVDNNDLKALSNGAKIMLLGVASTLMLSL